MKEQGIVIFPNGNLKSFGTYYCCDEADYLSMSTHKEEFEKEILNSFEFKSLDLFYNKEDTIYANSQRLSREGIIFIFNNRLSLKKPSAILSYVTPNPTLEQLETLSKNADINNTEIQELYEFNSDDWDDYIKYNNFKGYVEIKQNSIKNKNK